jgi:hypothetical protein
MISHEGKRVKTMKMDGVVTALCSCNDFLFIGFSAVIPRHTAVPVGCLKTVHITSGVEQYIASPGTSYAHRGDVLALEAVALPSVPVPVLFSGGIEGSLFMWRFESGVWKREAMGDGHVRTITSLCWHPQVNRLLSASLDMTVGIWDPAAPASPKVLLLPEVSGHKVGVMSVRRVNLGDAAGPYFMTADAHGVIAVWKFTAVDTVTKGLQCDGFERNPLTACEVIDVPGNATPLLVVGNSDGSVVLRSITDGLKTLVVLKAHSAAHDVGPVLVCPPCPTVPGFYTTAKDRKLIVWKYEGPGGTPPALAPAAPAAMAAASAAAVPPMGGAAPGMGFGSPY